MIKFTRSCKERKKEIYLRNSGYFVGEHINDKCER